MNPSEYLAEVEEVLDVLAPGDWWTFGELAEVLGESHAWVHGRCLEAERRGRATIRRTKPVALITVGRNVALPPTRELRRRPAC